MYSIILQNLKTFFPLINFSDFDINISLTTTYTENLNFNFPETNPYKIPYVYDHRLPFAFAKEENALLFDTDLFFTDSGSQYLRECMNTHFGVVLPPEADMLHIEWMKWMKHLNDTVFTK